jgi:hypothetical protein
VGFRIAGSEDVLKMMEGFYEELINFKGKNE